MSSLKVRDFLIQSIIIFTVLSLSADLAPAQEEENMPNLKNALTIEYLPINQLKDYDKEIRIHKEKQKKKTRPNLQKYGQVLPIPIDQYNVIIDGHLIWEILKELGYEQIAVVVVSNLTPEEIRGLRLALNRLSEDTEWDRKALAIEFQELIDLDFELEFTAFDEVEIEATLFIGGEEGLPEDNPFENVDFEVPTVSEIGDTWEAGDNRLTCGSSLEATVFDQLMGGEKAQMGFIDFPYNVAVNGHVCGLGNTKHDEFKMASGEMSSDEFQKFLNSSAQLLAKFSVDGALLFACMDWRHQLDLLLATKDVFSELKNMCVWQKTNAGMGSMYRSQHELIYVFKNGTAKHINNIELGKHGRSRSNVWNYPGVNTFGKDRMAELAMHPTVKPIAMVVDTIIDASHQGDIVLDSFSGSGTTIIACERTGRRARAIEISPKYVDVSIIRWQKETGKQAIHSETGELFDDVQARVLEGLNDA